MELLKRLNAKITNTAFLLFEKAQFRLFSKRKVNILFSPKQSWEQDLKDGFKYTGHEIAFEEFSPETIKRYDIIVPLTMDDLRYLHEIGESITDNPIPTPSMESILLCDDKQLFNKTLIANGFGDFIPAMDKVTYPYILKKRIDEWGENTHIIANAEQEEMLSLLVTDPDYLSQQLVVGSYEYATHLLIKEQKIICSLNIEYNFRTETPIKGKDKPIYKKICQSPYLDEFATVLSYIGFNGLCCINYKVHENRPLILEINPRFGGSLAPYFFSFIKQLS
ncbi:MAG: ATP-grasp domain-containing protein [Methylovulum sp.]|nr:ATP-grasp domain-containing protein [Methylovulum sp.]